LTFDCDFVKHPSIDGLVIPKFLVGSVPANKILFSTSLCISPRKISERACQQGLVQVGERAISFALSMEITEMFDVGSVILPEKKGGENTFSRPVKTYNNPVCSLYFFTKTKTLFPAVPNVYEDGHVCTGNAFSHPDIPKQYSLSIEGICAASIIAILCSKFNADLVGASVTEAAARKKLEFMKNLLCWDASTLLHSPQFTAQQFQEYEKASEVKKYNTSQILSTYNSFL
jgi:hypothetical protein